MDLKQRWNVYRSMRQSTISIRMKHNWKFQGKMPLYRVSKKETDSFEMQISRTALLQFDRRYIEIPLVQNIK